MDTLSAPHQSESNPQPQQQTSETCLAVDTAAIDLKTSASQLTSTAPTGFLTLPSELRQKIILLAFQDTCAYARYISQACNATLILGLYLTKGKWSAVPVFSYNTSLGDVVVKLKAVDAAVHNEVEFVARKIMDEAKKFVVSRASSNTAVEIFMDSRDLFGF